jgi:hypothetical protein
MIPIARVTVESLGSTGVREYAIHVALKLSAVGTPRADRAYVETIARRALEGFSPRPGEADQRKFFDVSVQTKGSRGQ